mgnify:CR=1 FL=1
MPSVTAPARGSRPASPDDAARPGASGRPGVPRWIWVLVAAAGAGALAVAAWLTGITAVRELSDPGWITRWGVPAGELVSNLAMTMAIAAIIFAAGMKPTRRMAFEDFIRRAYAAGVPLVGICFGHQIIAQALGGRVEKFPGGWSIGPQDYDFDGETVTLNAWHQDQVVERPQDAQVVASSGFCTNAALVYGDRAFTVQAHPEFDDAMIHGLIEHRSDTVPSELVAEALTHMDDAAQSKLIADRIEAFFKQPRAISRGAA